MSRFKDIYEGSYIKQKDDLTLDLDILSDVEIVNLYNRFSKIEEPFEMRISSRKIELNEKTKYKEMLQGHPKEKKKKIKYLKSFKNVVATIPDEIMRKIDISQEV